MHNIRLSLFKCILRLLMSACILSIYSKPAQFKGNKCFTITNRLYWVQICCMPRSEKHTKDNMKLTIITQKCLFHLQWRMSMSKITAKWCSLAQWIAYRKLRKTVCSILLSIIIKNRLEKHQFTVIPVIMRVLARVTMEALVISSEVFKILLSINFPLV